MSIVTLEVITDIHSSPDQDGNVKVIKKNVIYKKQFETATILVENYTGARGQIVKKYCIVRQDDNYFKLNHSFDSIEKLTQPIKFKGFEQKTRKAKPTGKGK